MSQTSSKRSRSTDPEDRRDHEFAKFFENTEDIVDWLLEKFLQSTWKISTTTEIKNAYKKLAKERRPFTPFPFMDVQGLAPRLKAITSGDAFDKNGFFQLIKRLWKFNLASLIYLVSEEQHLDQVLEYFFERALPGYVPCTEQVMKTYLAIVSRQLYHETNELYEDYDSDEEEGPNAMPILVKRLKPDPDSNTFENIPSWKLFACDFKGMAERHLKEILEFETLDDWDNAYSKENVLEKVKKLAMRIEDDIRAFNADIFDEHSDYQSAVQECQSMMYERDSLEKRSHQEIRAQPHEDPISQEADETTSDSEDHHDVPEIAQDHGVAQEEAQQVDDTEQRGTKRRFEEDQVAPAAKRHQTLPGSTVANQSDSYLEDLLDESYLQDAGKETKNQRNEYEDEEYYENQQNEEQYGEYHEKHRNEEDEEYYQNQRHEEEDEEDQLSSEESEVESEVPNTPQHSQPVRRRQLPWTTPRNPTSPIRDTQVGGGTKKLRKYNEYWTPEELEALEDGLRRFGRRWAKIKKEYPLALARRSQVQLKDKVRNQVISLEKQGKDLGVYAAFYD